MNDWRKEERGEQRQQRVGRMQKEGEAGRTVEGWETKQAVALGTPVIGAAQYEGEVSSLVFVVRSSSWFWGPGGS